MIVTRRGARAVLTTLIGLTAILAAPGAGAAAQSSVRVPADYFGSNFQSAIRLPSSLVNAHFARMHELGIGQARIVFPWRMIEPSPPNGDDLGYDFDEADQVMRLAALNGIGVQVNLAQAPDWASGVSGFDAAACHSSPDVHSLAPALGNARLFAAMAAAVARRYGPGGSFWAQNPTLDPDPVRRYEIWNEEQLRGAWCPAPQPDVYAAYFVAAARAIRAVQPGAQVVIGGMGLLSPNRKPPQYLTPQVFLQRALAAQPSMSQLASAVAVHLYPGITTKSQLDFLERIRSAVREGGIPDSMPLLLNEIGWSTRGDTAVTEDERVTAYQNLTEDLSRTNCNLIGILQHAWTSDQASNSTFSWVGIVNQATTNPYPSAIAFAKGIALERGQTATEPPTQTLMACPGMPLPDTDGDGVPDQDDYYPLDPSRSGSGGGGSGGGGSGGGSGSGGSGSGGDGSGDGTSHAHHHRKLRMACRRWYRTTAHWRSSGSTAHRRIVTRCVRRALALRRAGQLRPTIAASWERCGEAQRRLGYRGRRLRRRVRYCAYWNIRYALRHVQA